MATTDILLNVTQAWRTRDTRNSTHVREIFGCFMTAGEIY